MGSVARTDLKRPATEATQTMVRSVGVAASATPMLWNVPGRRATLLAAMVEHLTIELLKLL